MPLILHDTDASLEEAILVASDLSDFDGLDTPDLLKLLSQKATIFNRDYGGAIKEILKKNSAGVGLIDSAFSAQWWIVGKLDRGEDFRLSAYRLSLGCQMFWNEQKFWMSNHLTDGDPDFPMYFYRAAALIALNSDIKRGIARGVFSMDGENDFCACFAKYAIDPNTLTEIDKRPLDGMIELAAEMTVIGQKLVELNVSPKNQKGVLYRPPGGWASSGTEIQ